MWVLAGVDWRTGAMYLGGLVAGLEAFWEHPQREELVLGLMGAVGEYLAGNAFSLEDEEGLYAFCERLLYRWAESYRFFLESRRSLWETAVRMGEVARRLAGGETFVGVLLERGLLPSPEVYEVGRAVEEVRWGYCPWGWERPAVPSYGELEALLFPSASRGEGGDRSEGERPRGGALPSGLRIEVTEKVEPRGERRSTLVVELPQLPRLPMRKAEKGWAMAHILSLDREALYGAVLAPWAEAVVKNGLGAYARRLGLQVSDAELTQRVLDLWWQTLLVMVAEQHGLPDEVAAYEYLGRYGLTLADFTQRYLPALVMRAEAYVVGEAKR